MSPAQRSVGFGLESCQNLDSAIPLGSVEACRLLLLRESVSFWANNETNKKVDSLKELRSLGCRYGWIQYANSLPGTCISLPLGSASSVGLFHFQTSSLSWREEEVRDELERQAGVRARGLPCGLLRGLHFILRLEGPGEKFKMTSDGSRSACFHPSHDDLPCVLWCFCVCQKLHSAFRGLVTFRHVKYFSFLSFFFLKFLTLFEFNDSYYELFMKMIF